MPPDYEFVKVPSVCVIQMTQALPLTGRKIIYETGNFASTHQPHVKSARASQKHPVHKEGHHDPPAFTAFHFRHDVPDRGLHWQFYADCGACHSRANCAASHCDALICPVAHRCADRHPRPYEPPAAHGDRDCRATDVNADHCAAYANADSHATARNENPQANATSCVYQSAHSDPADCTAQRARCGPGGCHRGRELRQKICQRVVPVGRRARRSQDVLLG